MRSIDEIRTEQDSVLQKHPSLASLDSTSDVSLFSQIRNMWALLVQLLESSWEKTRAEIEASIAATRVGDLPWYVQQAKAFQFGDSVSIIAGKIAYDVIDSQKQIVVQAAATEDATGRLSIKVAKKGNDGLIPLIPIELDAFRAYVNKYKYAGTITDIVSIEADEVKLIATIKIDRQVISTSGALVSDPTKLPVHSAITSYLEKLPYTSLLSNTALTDALQSIPGVRDFTITSSFSRRPIQGSVWLPYSREVVSLAGHMRLHPDSILTFE